VTALSNGAPTRISLWDGKTKLNYTSKDIFGVARNLAQVWQLLKDMILLEKSFILVILAFFNHRRIIQIRKSK
jgi:hypothetical protein